MARQHRDVGLALQGGLVARGWELFANGHARLPELTTVWVPLDRLPRGMDEAARSAEICRKALSFMWRRYTT